MADKILPSRRQVLILGSGGPVVNGPTPATSTDNAIVRWDGTTGKLIQNSTITLSDTDGTFTQTTVNGDIILTPNGTGIVRLNAGSTGAVKIGPDNVTVPLRLYNANYYIQAATGLEFHTNSGDVMRWMSGASTVRMYLAGTGNLLLGGLTTDGTGVLQFPAASTNAGGIFFGADTSIYRLGNGQVMMETTTASQNFQAVYSSGSSASSAISLRTANVEQARITGNSSGGLVLGTNGGTAALTLDSSQNATFSGVIVHKAYTVATLPTASSYTYGIAFVSDATNVAGANIGTSPTGGGAVKRAVYSDGTNWLLL